MSTLQNKLHYAFQNPSLLRQALTHPSLKEDADNQRLEFLGDAVLECLISDLLYHKYPNAPEGELTAKRAALVCEETLSSLARTLGLGQALRMNRGEELTRGRQKPSILADALEAVLAAVYLDGGLSAAMHVVNHLFQQEEKLASIHGGDDKGLLQAYTQANNMELPAYEITAESGPPHDRHFVAQVRVLGKTIATGEGTSKKAAEQAAAKAALAAYQRVQEGEDAAQ